MKMALLWYIVRTLTLVCPVKILKLLVEANYFLGQIEIP